MPSGMGHALSATPEVARIPLSYELRLGSMPRLIDRVNRAYLSGAKRIELDVSELRLFTEGAKRMLLVATARLEELGVALVLVG